jgi:hypothetical protein
VNALRSCDERSGFGFCQGVNSGFGRGDVEGALVEAGGDVIHGDRLREFEAAAVVAVAGLQVQRLPSDSPWLSEDPAWTTSARG